MKNNNQGFTLIEILVVIGIIAVLAGIVLIAINPARQFRQARNSERHSEVNAILNAIGQKVADSKGTATFGVDSDASTFQEIGKGSGMVDICSSNSLVTTYIAALPMEPSEAANASPNETQINDCSATTWSTGYKINLENGRYTVAADGEDPEAGTNNIKVTR